MLKSISFFIFFATVGIAVSACSHAPTAANARNDSNAQSDFNAQDWMHASVDIHYVLRHSDRRLTLESDDQGVHGKSLVDGTQLKQCQIDTSRYQEFMTKVRSFVSQRRSIASTASSQASSQSLGDCRAPYTITLKNQKDTIQIQGCRVQEEGAFSHLVQEGEFLIYRQK